MANGDQRLVHLRRFYRILRRLNARIGGPRYLAECNRDMDWPIRGVYFFMEAGERRSDSGRSLRIVRVGTVTNGTLWRRLYAHSIGRLFFGRLVMKALAERDGEATRDDAAEEICDMPFLWLAVDEDVSGSNTDRRYIECNAIALLSNYQRIQFDPPSRTWLGHFSERLKIARSVLWNSHFVDYDYDYDFLDTLEGWANDM